MSGKSYRGRQPGTKVTYTPQQTARYQSSATRQQKSLSLQPDRIEEATGETRYFYASKRSPSGFWTVTVQETANRWVLTPVLAEQMTSPDLSLVMVSPIPPWDGFSSLVRLESPIVIPAGQTLRLKVRATVLRSAGTPSPSGLVPGASVAVWVRRSGGSAAVRSWVAEAFSVANEAGEIIANPPAAMVFSIEPGETTDYPYVTSTFGSGGDWEGLDHFDFVGPDQIRIELVTNWLGTGWTWGDFFDFWQSYRFELEGLAAYG